MNKKIIITGASRGIGRETALLCASYGYDLFLISSKSREELLKLQLEILNKYDVNVETAISDVGKSSDIMPLLKNQHNVYALINNAAISSVKLMTDMSLDEWQRLMDVNLNSLFYTTKAVLPEMISRKEGRIINISSVWGNVGASMEVAYSASKGGVNAFTKALAKELAPSNIAVNAVAFGVIDTKMNDCISAEDMEELKSEIPADRIGTPKEAAEMILKVLEAPSYMTGQIITMDGGWI